VVVSDDEEVCVDGVVVLDKQHERLEHLGQDDSATPALWISDLDQAFGSALHLKDCAAAA